MTLTVDNGPLVNIKLCPIRIEEVKEGKIWNITYEMENIVFTDPKAIEGFKMLGVDFYSEKFAHKVMIQLLEYR